MSGIHMGLLASKPPGPAFVSFASTPQTNTTTLVINKPAGVVSGMLLVALMATASVSGRTWTGDAGWNERIDQGAQLDLRIATLVAGGAEPASYTFTVSGAATLITGMILAFERATYDTIGAIGTATGGANCVAPSINCSLPGLLLAIYGIDPSPSAPAGMTSLASYPSFSVFSQFSNIGATGTRTTTPFSTGDLAGILVSLI